MCRMAVMARFQKGPLNEVAGWVRHLAYHGRLRADMEPPREGELRHGDGIGYVLLKEWNQLFEYDKEGRDNWFSPAIWNVVQNSEGIALAMHTRRTSGSETSKEFAHPFVFADGKLALMHNGTIKFPGYKKQSDTLTWIKEYIEPAIKNVDLTKYDEFLDAFVRATEQAIQNDFTSASSIIVSPWWIIAVRWFNDDATRSHIYEDYYTLYHWYDRHTRWVASEPMPSAQNVNLLRNRHYIVFFNTGEAKYESL
ncbi:MAG: hypothetical protein GXO48_03930 [Chlorobi bacterium]|nr:hypothetical protein [Chlorobiota bacterium]